VHQDRNGTAAQADQLQRRVKHIAVPTLYAEGGISECWLVDLGDRAVEVYRQPSGGRYAEVRRVGLDGTLHIAALPGTSLPAANLLRPARS